MIVDNTHESSSNAQGQTKQKRKISPLTKAELQVLLAHRETICSSPLLYRRFPVLIIGTQANELLLTVRAQNCLNYLLAQGEISRIDDLERFTLRELLGKKNFGRKSLLNLLEAALPFVQELGSGVGDCVEDKSVSANDMVNPSLTRTEIVSLLRDPKSLTPSLLNRRFPQLPVDMTPDQLLLTVRIQRFIDQLVASGSASKLHHLSQFTLRQILRNKNFGRKSLLDLLKAVLPVVLHSEDEETRNYKEFSNRLTTEAERLRSKQFARQVRCNDPRFTDDASILLAAANVRPRAAPLTLADTLEAVAHALAARDREYTNPDELIAAIRRLRTKVARVQRITLDSELKQIAGTLTDKRNLNIILSFYGWNGHPPRTLQAVGDSHNITRERVRQITTKFAEKVKLFHPYCPRLLQAIGIVRRCTPLPTVQIQQMLINAKLVPPTGFAVESILSAATVLRKSVGFWIENLHGVTMAVATTDPSGAKHVIPLAKRLASRFGVVTVSDLHERLQNIPEVSGTDQNTVASILRSYSSIVWLDQGHKWFSIANLARNHLVTIINKILSVSPRIHVSEIRDGISGDPRGLGFAPPKNVILKFCELLCKTRVKDEFVIAGEEKPIDDILSPMEKIAYEVLRKNGPLLHRWTFERLCTEAGMNDITFGLYLTRSPILGRYGPGIYGVRGTMFTESDLKKCTHESTPCVSDQGWTGNAEPWAVIKLSENAVGTGMVFFPAAIRQFIVGRHLLRLEDGSTAGILVVSEKNAWGLKPVFRRAGVQPGDGALFIFDLARGESKIRFGDVTQLICNMNELGSQLDVTRNCEKRGEVIPSADPSVALHGPR